MVNNQHSSLTVFLILLKTTAFTPVDPGNPNVILFTGCFRTAMLLQLPNFSAYKRLRILTVYLLTIYSAGFAVYDHQAYLKC